MIRTEINTEFNLDNYRSVSLERLERLNLLSRFDIKFAVHLSKLPQILSLFQHDYSILEIDGRRNFCYNNQYFDTKDYMFYNQHHNGKANRDKIRFRNYSDSSQCYFEIKHKSNNSKTSKIRIRINNQESSIFGEVGNLIVKELGIHPEDLIQTLNVSYKRITLINEKKQEKITLDRNIEFHTSDEQYCMTDIALIEVKQKCINNDSESIQSLKKLNVHKISGFSKYCMGLVNTNKKIKYNRFKKQQLLIKKIMRQENGE